MADLQQDATSLVTSEPNESVRLSVTSKPIKEMDSTNLSSPHIEPQYEPPIQAAASSQTQNKPLKLKLKTAKLKGKEILRIVLDYRNCN
jgi:hypothetical protein